MMGLLAKSADGDSTVRDRCRVSCDILCIASLYDRQRSHRTIQHEKMMNRKMLEVELKWMKCAWTAVGISPTRPAFKRLGRDVLGAQDEVHRSSFTSSFLLPSAIPTSLHSARGQGSRPRKERRYSCAQRVRRPLHGVTKSTRRWWCRPRVERQKGGLPLVHVLPMLFPKYRPNSRAHKHFFVHAGLTMCG